MPEEALPLPRAFIAVDIDDTAKRRAISRSTCARRKRPPLDANVHLTLMVAGLLSVAASLPMFNYAAIDCRADAI